MSLLSNVKKYNNAKIVRFFDILFSSVGLLVLLPFILGLFVHSCFSKNQLIFSQVRLGKGRSTFTIFKVRTMAEGTPSIATHNIGNEAVTKIGKVLRRYKIDEIPQLWNVLKGEMSLVGPRPGLPIQHELTQAREKVGVYSVPPGITGLAQLKGIDMSTPDLIAKTDSCMISSMSVFNYFRYIFLTVAGNGRGDRIRNG